MDNDITRKLQSEIDHVSKNLEKFFLEDRLKMVQGLVPIILILIAKILLATYRLHLEHSYE